MTKKRWTNAKEYCTHCRRFVKPSWDVRRKLWVCPLCYHCVVR